MNEEVLYTARTHPKVLFKAVVIFVLLLILQFFLFKVWPSDTGWDWFDSWGAWLAHAAVLGLQIWFVVVPVLQWKASLFTLTNKRVKMNWGVITQQSREIDLHRITSISEERGILDRIFGCGTLNFYDAASSSQSQGSNEWDRSTGNNGVKFNDVPSVKEVRKKIEQAKYSADGSS